MNILIATDKFKDALPASSVCNFLKKGILQTFPDANCSLLPLADGGEGTLESLQTALGGVFKNVKVFDPYFRNIIAPYLYLEDSKIAVIEMARASGIELIEPKDRNCLKTTSYGTGQQIIDAIKNGAREIILTVGGTATNDAGIGIASALGFKFLDEQNREVIPIGENLTKITQICTTYLFESLSEVKFTIATDVTNSFYGEKGAAYVFARQKGAADDDIILLDEGLRKFATVLENNYFNNPQSLIGAGAGGGVAGGLACLLNAEIISAASWILQINKFSQLLENNVILITGEGKVDSQTWDGKLISEILIMAQNAKVPVVVVCGTLQGINEIVAQPAVLYATSILKEPLTLPEAIKQSPQLIENQGILLGKLLSKITL